MNSDKLYSPALEMNRIIRHIGLSLCTIIITLSCTRDSAPDPVRPNIIFMMADDHSYKAISAYDQRLIHTPNIDRLAEEGMLFTNACVTNSICAPSRAVILTGKHSHINGKIDNRAPFDTTNVTFPQLLQENGYQTAMFGKLHFGNNPKGIDDFSILPGQGNYINPSFITPAGDTTIMGYVTDIITDLSLDWLKNKRQKDKPFMMAYLHKAPHRPWWPEVSKFEEFTENEYAIPPTLHTDNKSRGSAAQSAEMKVLENLSYHYDLKIPKDHINSMDDIKPHVGEPGIKGSHLDYVRMTAAQKRFYDPVLEKIGESFTQNWSKLSTDEKRNWKVQRYLQDYLACISSLDDNVGRLLDYLEYSGLAENTIVVYTSDQGFYLGENGWYDKRFIYDESFKTPLIVRWPSKTAPGSINHTMVQNLDFAQTLLEVADIDVPMDMQGESLVPLLTGDTSSWTRDAVYYHYYEYPAVHMVKRHYGIVTEDFKLAHFYHDVDEWELYDRKKDPYDLVNVIDHPDYQEVLESLKLQLKTVREKYGDSEELDQYYIDNYVANH